LNSALDKIKRLRPIRFKYTKEALSHLNCNQDKEYIGFLGTEYAQVFPDSISITDTGHLSISYDPLFPVLVASVKELDEEVNRLTSIVESLRGRNV
jgi:hypothetical protein